jgi:predicted RNA polymerase sigma factor
VAVTRGRAQQGGRGRRGRRAAAALAEVEALERDGRLAGYHYLPAVKADLLRRLGRAPGAAYRDAIALAGNDVERAYLESLTAGSPRDPSSHLY